MSTVKLTRESHVDATKYRIKHADAVKILGPNIHFPIDDKKPIVSSASEVAIIGAGFGGVTASLACKQKMKTNDFVVFEKHYNWGGTWWANTYPGCASDIPALWYSIHSELNKNWSDLRPPQYEMEEYILAVTKKHDLDKHARFGTVVSKMVWNEDEGVWILHASNIKTGQRFEHKAKILLNCQGGLVYPIQLNAPGLNDKFQGSYMHSAVWDHSVDFKDKKVIVVGNGCSAAQVIPAVMNELDAKSVTQVFRSKHWIMPPLPPFVFKLYKLLSGTRLGLILIRWLVILAAELRYPMYQGSGLFARLARWVVTRQSRKYIMLAPKKYHDLLMPDYKIGCKRLIYDYKYIPSLSSPKFDLHGSPIKEVLEKEVILQDGTRLEADIIVACTGYDVSKSFYGSYTVVGQNGILPQELWKKEGVSAYKTSMIRDCPNMFFIAGPNSATGHFSVVSAIENCCAFASRVARPVLDGKSKSVIVKRSAYYDWFQKTQLQLQKAVFGTKFGGCVSWYTEGGINATAYPYSQLYYWITSRWFGSKDLIYQPLDLKKTV